MEPDAWPTQNVGGMEASRADFGCLLGFLGLLNKPPRDCAYGDMHTGKILSIQQG